MVLVGEVEVGHRAGLGLLQKLDRLGEMSSICLVVSWELESGLVDCRTRLAAAARVAGAYRERARAISEGCGDREIHGSDLGRMCALLQVRAEGDEVIGEDVKWALGIAVTALVLMAFLLHVPFALVLGPWRTRGRVRDRNPRWRDRPFFVRAS